MGCCQQSTRLSSDAVVEDEGADAVIAECCLGAAAQDSQSVFETLGVAGKLCTGASRVSAGSKSDSDFRSAEVN